MSVYLVFSANYLAKKSPGLGAPKTGQMEADHLSGHFRGHFREFLSKRNEKRQTKLDKSVSAQDSAVFCEDPRLRNAAGPRKFQAKSAKICEKNFEFRSVCRGSVNGGFQTVVRALSGEQIPTPQINLDLTSVFHNSSILPIFNLFFLL